MLLPLVLQQSAAFSLLQQRTNAPLQQRTTNAPIALRASDDALDASSPDAFLAGLMNRVDELKARQLELPIVVLDATLPNQRLAISTSDQAFREMIEWCGVKAVEEAGGEQFDDQRRGRFGIVGVDRQTGNAFPFGVEAIILKASVASETSSVELKRGGFTADETQDEAPAGAVQPRKVTLAPELDDDDEAAAVAAAQRLPALVEQWETVWELLQETFVDLDVGRLKFDFHTAGETVVDGGHERQPDHLGLVRKHLGPMPGPERPTDLSLSPGNQPVQMQFGRRRRVDGVRRPKFDFHTGHYGSGLM